MSNACSFSSVLLRITILNFISFFLSSCNSNVSHFKNAQKEFLNDDYIGAIIELNTLFESTGKTDSALVLRAKCYLKIQKLNRALKDLKEANQMNPNNSEAKLELGRYYVLVEDTLNATNILTQVANGKSNSSSDAFIELGKINYFKDKFELSISNFTDAIEEDSSNYLAWYYRAIMRSTFYDKDESSTQSLFKYLDFNQAINDYKRAISIRNNFADAWYRMGLVYLNKFDEPNGIKAINQAIALEPINSYYYIGRADFYARKEEYQKAIKDYCTAIEIAQNDPTSYEGRALCYKALGNTELFKEDFKKAFLLRKDLKSYKVM
jgi:tetratricopeptide (TPR) repeat protein